MPSLRPLTSLASLALPLALSLLVACSDDSGGGTSYVGGGQGPGGSSAQAGQGGSAQGGQGGSSQAGQGGSGQAGQGGSGQTASSGKVDLLLMVDNSASMADKQALLAHSVPQLVGRLVNPRCVDAQGAALPSSQQPTSPAGACPQGSQRETAPVTDLHVGVVTSSLGGHGADLCVDVDPGAPSQTANNNFTKNDHARLITRGPRADSSTVKFPEVPTYHDAGFLAWDPSQKLSPPGESDAASLAGKAGQLILGSDQIGCGYESQLEAWYRFLVEPKPPAKVLPPASTGAPATVEGVDALVLAQRKDFLRPDSLVAVVMLTDENDCSIIDGTLPADVCEDPALDAGGMAVGCKVARVGWPADYGVDENFSDVTKTGDGRVTGTPFPANYLVAQQKANGAQFHMAPGTGACKADPYSPACKSCFVAPDQPECAGSLSFDEDAPQLRCFDQKKRFGVSALYPIGRYVRGLRDPKVYDREGFLVENPLFQGGLRGPGTVVLTTLVGVPWQDLAVDPQDITKGLKSSAEVDWELIHGDPFNRDAAKRHGPSDPLMKETSDARSGTLVTGETLGSGAWNSVNGHEWKAGPSDLQYACIFPLPLDRDCSQGVPSCDCDPSSLDAQSPLCEGYSPSDPQKKGTGMTTTTQARGKGYPATRILEVARLTKDQSVVGSICGTTAVSPADPAYGYGAALSLVAHQLAVRLPKQPQP